MKFYDGATPVVALLALIAGASMTGGAPVIAPKVSNNNSTTQALESAPGQAYLAVLGAGRMGSPIWGGTGCSQSSVAWTIAPDGKSLSLLFQGYEVAAGEAIGWDWQEKECTVKVPVTVQANECLKGFTSRTRVGDTLPRNATRKFSARYGISSGNNYYAGIEDSDSVYGWYDDEMIYGGGLKDSDFPFSICNSTDAVLIINTALRVDFAYAGNALAQITSTDVTTEPYSAATPSSKPGLLAVLLSPIAAAGSWLVSRSR